MEALIAKLKILLRVERSLFQLEAGRRSRNALLGALSVGCLARSILDVTPGDQDGLELELLGDHQQICPTADAKDPGL